MMSVHKPKYNKKEISQRFNLKNLLGYSPTEEQKRAFFDLAADKMVERTTSGKDITGRKFTPYSESYAKKKGVPINSVDLVLTGDMLSSFEQSQRQKNVVKIQLDESQAEKAYNHNVGDTLPKRTFFGFRNEKDIEDIITKIDSMKESKVKPQLPFNALAIKRAVDEEINVEFGGFDGDS